MSKLTIEQFGIQIEQQYLADIAALERVKKLIEEGYQQRLKWLEQLTESLTPNQVEYVPGSQSTLSNGNEEYQTEVLASEDLTLSSREDGTITATTATSPKEQIKSLISVYAGPFKASELLLAGRSAGILPEIALPEIKSILRELQAEKLIDRYNIQTETGVVSYYQDAQNPEDIKMAVKKKIQAKAVSKQIPSDNTNPVLDTGSKPYQGPGLVKLRQRKIRK